MSSFSLPRPAAPYSSRIGWLPLSIAVNLLLIGFLLAWVVSNQAPAPRQPLVTWQRELMPTLSTSDAAVATDAVSRIAASQVACDDAVHAEYAQIRAVLAVEPVDNGAIQAHFDKIIALRNAQQNTALHAFGDELKNLSPEGRRIILTGMEKESQRLHPATGH
jgi:hypothetical protein